MLGLRHYRGFAIDLWQGQVRQFSTDILACISGQDHTSHPQEIELAQLLHDPATNAVGLQVPKEFSISMKLTSAGNFPAHVVMHLSIDSEARGSDYELLWKTALGLDFRHLTFWSIFIGKAPEFVHDQATMAFTALKYCLDLSVSREKGLGRITFLAPDSATYSTFQNVFFSIFPEAI